MNISLKSLENKTNKDNKEIKASIEELNNLIINNQNNRRDQG